MTLIWTFGLLVLTVIRFPVNIIEVSLKTSDGGRKMKS